MGSLLLIICAFLPHLLLVVLDLKALTFPGIFVAWVLSSVMCGRWLINVQTCGQFLLEMGEGAVILFRDGRSAAKYLGKKADEIATRIHEKGQEKVRLSFLPLLAVTPMSAEQVAYVVYALISLAAFTVTFFKGTRDRPSPFLSARPSWERHTAALVPCLYYLLVSDRLSPVLPFSTLIATLKQHITNETPPKQAWDVAWQCLREMYALIPPLPNKKKPGDDVNPPHQSVDNI